MAKLLFSIAMLATGALYASPECGDLTRVRTFQEVFSHSQPESIRKCRYLVGDKICHFGNSKPKCEGISETWQGLSTIIRYRHCGTFCIQKITEKAQEPNLRKQKGQPAQSKTVCFDEKTNAPPSEAYDLLCNPWDGTEESTMRIGN